jgi:hypothetical protein
MNTADEVMAMARTRIKMGYRMCGSCFLYIFSPLFFLSVESCSIIFHGVPWDIQVGPLQIGRRLRYYMVYSGRLAASYRTTLKFTTLASSRDEQGAHHTIQLTSSNSCNSKAVQTLEFEVDSVAMLDDALMELHDQLC